MLRVAKSLSIFKRQSRPFNEALRIAGIKALHAADDITLGDDGCAERGIPIAIQNLREALREAGRFTIVGKNRGFPR